MRKPTCSIDAFKAIQASAKALRKVGAINEEKIRNFEEECFRQASTIVPELRIISQVLVRQYRKKNQNNRSKL